MKAVTHTLLVGGTTEIGRVLARRFARKGRVSILGRRQTSNEKQVKYYQVDIANTTTTCATLDRALDSSGPIRHLIFLQRFRGVGNTMNGEMKVSLEATKTIIDHLCNSFVLSGNRSIVVVLSVATRFIALEQPLIYHVAKSGQEQIVRYYAATLGRKGIRVNGVSPSTILKETNRVFYTQHPSLRNLYSQLSPLGRMCTVNDLANVIEFLSGPRASFVTGQNVIVDGGISLLWHECMARNLTALQTVKVTRD